MQRLVLILMLDWTGAAAAQNAPREFKQPAPGQVAEPMRERLRIAPMPLRVDRSEHIGLPSTGPKGLLRESFNEPKYTPSSDR